MSRNIQQKLWCSSGDVIPKVIIQRKRFTTKVGRTLLIFKIQVDVPLRLSLFPKDSLQKFQKKILTLYLQTQCTSWGDICTQVIHHKKKKQENFLKDWCTAVMWLTANFMPKWFVPNITWKVLDAQMYNGNVCLAEGDSCTQMIHCETYRKNSSYHDVFLVIRLWRRTFCQKIILKKS